MHFFFSECYPLNNHYWLPVAVLDVPFFSHFLHIFLHFCAQLSCLYNVCGHEAPMAVSSHPHQARLARAWSQIFWAVKNSLVEPRPSQPPPATSHWTGQRQDIEFPSFGKPWMGCFSSLATSNLNLPEEDSIFPWYSGQTTNFLTFADSSYIESLNY